MKITTKKKHAVLASLVLILGVAVLANWYLTSPDTSISQVMGESDIDSENADSQNLGDAVLVNSTDISDEYFASAKLSRDEAYDEAVATLKEIIESSDIDEQSVKTASDAIASMTERQLAQTNIENLVEAKTGSKCVAVLSEDSAEIIVSDVTLTDSVVLQINEIVVNNSDISAEKISIIGAK